MITDDKRIQHLVDFALSLPFNKVLGLTCDQILKDNVTISFALEPKHIGNSIQNMMHGGVISAVIDMAGGLNAMASIVYKNPDATFEQLAALVSKSSTISLTINYVQPGRGQRFFAHSKVVRSGNKICFTHTDFLNEESRLIATGTATYLIG